MFHIPKVITILGQRFSVRVEPDPIACLDPRQPQTFEAFGSCDRGKGEIVLRGPDGISEDKCRETLLHEVLHAVIGTSRIPPFGHEDGEVEEGFVSMLAPLLLDTLRDNPDLVNALMYVEADSTVVAHGVMTDDHAH